MSVTQCRSCGESITFVLRDDGRWRPVDVTYTVLELDGDEMACLQAQGSWTVTSVRELRVYRAHACPENPAWNRGSARTRRLVEGEERVVDLLTGEIEDDPSSESQPMLWMQREREYCIKRIGERLIKVGCPGCGVSAGDPCRLNNRWLLVPCRARRLAAAFTDDEPWPPRSNQGGYVQMRRWLRDHHNLFAITTEETP